MSHKDIYCMGRAEYLAEYKGYTLMEAYIISEEEWNNVLTCANIKNEKRGEK